MLALRKGPEGRDIRKDDKRRKFTSQSTRFLTLRQEATASRFDDRLERHYAFQIPLPDEIVVLNCDPVPLPPSFKAVKEVIRPKGRCNFHLGKTKLKAGITVRYWLEISIHPGAQNISWVRSPKDTFMDVTLPKREAHIPECATEAQYDGLHYVVLPNPVSMDRVHPFTVRLMCVIPTVSDIEIFLMRKVSESERNAQKQLFKTEQIPTRVERYSTEQGSHIIRGTFSCAPTVPTFSISFLAVEVSYPLKVKPRSRKITMIFCVTSTHSSSVSNSRIAK